MVGHTGTLFSVRIQRSKTTHNIVHMPLRGDKLICRFSSGQHPVSWDDFGVGRAKHFATLHFLALLFPQRHMHGSLAATLI